jgi:hypothetical protein
LNPESLPRWRLRAPGALDWREWDGEFVVRSGSSGDTCLLSAVAGHAVIALKAAGPLSVPELVTQLFGTTTGGLSDAEVDALQATLGQLQHLGLVEAVAP